MPALLAAAVHAAVLGATAGTAWLLPAGPVHAQTENLRVYEIPAGPLDEAIGRFGRAAGLLLAADPQLTSGLRSPGLQGRYAVEQGLARLLAGTGLEAVRTADGGYALRRVPVAASSGPGIGTPALHEIRVTATAEDQLLQSLGVSIITQEDLERRPPANDLAEILMTQPGVSFSGASSVGAYGNQREIDLRGMGAENTMILVDGKPVQSRQGAITRRTGDRDTSGDTNWVPPDQIERIEIIRGPAAARYGSGASGGVVNIITKKPTGTLTGSVTTYLSKPESSLEGHGTRRLGFNLAGPMSENLSFRLYGNVARTDGDKPTINGVLDDGSPNWVAGREGRRNRDLNGLLRWDLTPHQVLEFEAGFSRLGNRYAGDTSNTTPSGAAAELLGEWAERGAETRRVYRQNASVTHRGDWGDVGKSRVIFQYENSRTVNCRQGASGMGEGNCGTAGALQNSDMDNYFLNGELNTPLKLGGLDQVLTTGIELRRMKLLDDNALLSTATPPEFVEMKSNTTAFYVEDNIGIGDALILTPGLRFDHHSQFGNNWSPSLNATYALGDGFTLKGGIARVFKAPTPYQTSPFYASGLGGACPYNGLGLDPDSYDCTVRGNPALKPEISVNQEIGVAWDGRRGWNASLAYFRNDYKNRIIAEALSGFDVDHPIDFEWRNSGKALVHGLEGSFSVPLLGPNGNQLRLLNNLTWMFKNINKDTGQPLSVIPKYTLNSTLDWRATDRFSMQLTSTLYGRRKPRTMSYHGYRMVGDALRQRGSYVLLGLSGTYEINKTLRLGLGVSNLFDRQIKRAARLAAGNVASGDPDSRVISTGAGALTYNEPGRAYYLTLTASF
ncbi:FepA family TonB-dependent siderophore receptor [Pseudorhodoferax sp.]|uniref:FepA family TonB-dependent siderophore receptor n=1 Tax=Pseudorhodoferax sp. TaxID=1993553 RepID=UPI0039E6CA10